MRHCGSDHATRPRSCDRGCGRLHGTADAAPCELRPTRHANSDRRVPDPITSTVFPGQGLRPLTIKCHRGAEAIIRHCVAVGPGDHATAARSIGSDHATTRAATAQGGTGAECDHRAAATMRPNCGCGTVHPATNRTAGGGTVQGKSIARSSLPARSGDGRGGRGRFRSVSRGATTDVGLRAASRRSPRPG
jgi:hypothetical protein